MRCPKCGYNSFDHLDSCKKCGKDLVEFKQSFGIQSVLFPGQMRPGGAVEETEFDNAAADAAVSVATGVAAAADTTPAVSTADDESLAGSADGDDFGFDFMGDSAEDDDLSFDELFEEAPEDEDIEETIEAPKEAATESGAESDDDFSFDLPDENAELEDDFGFDLEDDASDPVDESEDSGIEGDPKRPFDLPEFPQSVGAPEDSLNLSEESPSVFTEESDSPTVASTPESYVFELDEPVLSAPATIEPSESIATEVETVAVAAAPLVVATMVPVSVVSPVVPDVQPEVVADSAALSLPLVGNRVGAFIFDLALLSIVGISFVVAAEAAISTGETRLLPSLETLIDLSVPYFLVLFFLAFGYFTLFHFLTGQTPGKMLAGLRVETTEGEPLAFAQAFLRSVGGLLQLLPAGLGYLVILTSPSRRGWNDRLAGTRVIALRELR